MYIDLEAFTALITTERQPTENRHRTMLRDLKARITALGIEVKNFSNKTQFGWDGRTISLEGNSPARKLHDLAHEFSHWLMSTPERRALPEFGLGAGFSTIGFEEAQKACMVTNREADREEVATCYVASLILNEIGANANEESEFTNITRNKMLECSDNEATSLLEMAIERGAITRDLKVNWPSA